MSDNWTDFLQTFEAKWAASPTCPFCGSEGKKLESFWVSKPTPHQKHRITCQMCGGSGAVGNSPEEAIDNWSRRTESGYYPLGEHTYLLPGGQKYSHLMIHGDGTISLIDYVEQETMPPDGIAAQLDVNMGKFKISRWVQGGKRAVNNVVQRQEASDKD